MLAARRFFEQENAKLRERYHAEYSAAYNYNTNVTEENRRSMIAVYAESASQNKLLAQAVKSGDYADSTDPTIRRQARMLQDLGADVLNPEDYLELKNAVSAMQSNYATTTVCSYTNRSDCSLTLEPHIQERLAHSRDPAELAWYWREWYDKAGTPQRENFAKYVQLTRKAAHLNGKWTTTTKSECFADDNPGVTSPRLSLLR